MLFWKFTKHEKFSIVVALYLQGKLSKQKQVRQASFQQLDRTIFWRQQAIWILDSLILRLKILSIFLSNRSAVSDEIQVSVER